MWRAFFFSIGVILMLLGLECLVVDQFHVSRQGEVAQLVNKGLNVLDPEKRGSDKPDTSAAKNGSRTDSPFGSSRFQLPYSQARTTDGNPANGGGFGLASFSQTPPSNQAKSPQPRVVKTQDWMPWSLLAIGTITLLYTRVTGNPFTTGSTE